MLNEIFDKKIDQLKVLADVLEKYSHHNNCKEFEKELLLLKKSEIFFDGYNLVFHFSKTNYENYTLDNLQVYSRDFSILPFDVPFKFAQSFYKDINNVSYLESEVDSVRVYCWMLLKNKKDNSFLLPVDEYSKKFTKHGIKYFYIEIPYFDFLK